MDRDAANKVHASGLKRCRTAREAGQVRIRAGWRVCAAGETVKRWVFAAIRKAFHFSLTERRTRRRVFLRRGQLLKSSVRHCTPPDRLECNEAAGCKLND